MNNVPELNKKPLVFISHHSDDRKLALAFGELLRDVSMGVVSTFCSSDEGVGGIPAGAEYFQYLRQQLENATDVVCLLTEHSSRRPWLLWEAGVARGHGCVVYGVMVGVRAGDLDGTPFVHFQNKKCEKEALGQFIAELLNKHGLATHPPTSVHWATIYSRVMEFLEKQAGLMKMPAPARSIQEILADVEQLLKERKPQTAYVGRYPDYFETEVCQLLETAQSSMQIACDYPAYGYLTQHSLYLKYRKSLMASSERLLKAGGAVSVTVAAADIRAKMIQNPVPPDTTAFMNDFMHNPLYKAGIQALSKFLGKAPSGPDVLYDGIAEVNELETQDYPFQFRYSTMAMPIFAWIVDRKKAAFAIPTYLKGDVSIEHAFSTTDPKLIEALEAIVSGYPTVEGGDGNMGSAQAKELRGSGYELASKAKLKRTSSKEEAHDKIPRSRRQG